MGNIDLVKGEMLMISIIRNLLAEWGKICVFLCPSLRYYDLEQITWKDTQALYK